MKTRRRSLVAKSKTNSAQAEPKESQHRPSAVSETVASERHVAEKPEGAKNYKTSLPSYRFQRARTPGIIEVLNENSYVMAEYSERTGSVKWQRMVLASQREQIEKWLDAHYPRA